MRLHPLFVFVMGASLLTGYFIELFTLFCIVFVHELGHVYAAKSFGWRIKEIKMLPFGGVASMDEQASIPLWQEIVVALAGPLQNVLMIVFTWCMMTLGIWESAWSQYFIYVNAMIAIFNLIPILPLDGGKIGQALLSYYLPYFRAVYWSHWFSMILSAASLCLLFFPHPFLQWNFNIFIVSLFLIYSNWHDYKNIQYTFFRFLVHRELRKYDAETNSKDSHGKMHPLYVKRAASIQHIARCFRRDKEHCIFVVNESGKVEQFVTEKQIIQCFFSKTKRKCAVSDLFM